MDTRCCKNCCFWHEFPGDTPDKDGLTAGDCLRYPPVVLMDEAGDISSEVPGTISNFWCGEYLERTPEVTH